MRHLLWAHKDIGDFIAVFISQKIYVKHKTNIYFLHFVDNLLCKEYRTIFSISHKKWLVFNRCLILIQSYVLSLVIFLQKSHFNPRFNVFYNTQSTLSQIFSFHKVLLRGIITIVESWYFYLDTIPVCYGDLLLSNSSGPGELANHYICSFRLKDEHVIPGGPIMIACPSRSSAWLRSEHLP